MKIELIIDQDCPHVQGAREAITSTLKSLNLKTTWQEWDRNDENAPAHARLFGSPTILINGVDIAGEQPSHKNNCCRIYKGDSGEFLGIPSKKILLQAITKILSQE